MVMKVFQMTMLLLTSAPHQAFSAGCTTIEKRDLMIATGIAAKLAPFVKTEFGDCSNISLSEGFATFKLNDENVKIHNGVRSELVIDYPFREGETVEYVWSAKFPSGTLPGSGPKDWWLVAQWHDQPDVRAGETWSQLKKVPPPISVYVEKRSGSLGVGLAGIGGQKLSWQAIPPDTWLTFTVQIMWSLGHAGRVTMQISSDATVIASMEHSGRNMHNSYQHYFKVGQYRAPWIKTTSMVQVREVNISTVSP